ncbi:30S ribosome-binding factor RbfA [SAR86 cluster bacterium]|nr:30S ribosome-binding factor RbfA [SAR86 cluster bacterium]
MTNKYSFKRSDRIADLIFREISNLVQAQVKDPRLENTVITKVEMSDNMKTAKIFYRNLISSTDQAELEKGFIKASGFLRSSLARNLSLKRVPSLIFIFDELNIYD